MGLRHCCNSGAILAYPEMQMDMVRPGDHLVWLSPSDDLRDRADLRPVMTLCSRIAMIKTVDAGIPVSYGRTYTTGQKRRVATVTCGYADGYPRVLSNRACMLAGGRRAPVIGRICMDQTMLDVTDCPEAQVGDTVLLAGGEGPGFEELAGLAGTIHYELLCNVGRRVPACIAAEAVLRMWWIIRSADGFACFSDGKAYTDVAPFSKALAEERGPDKRIVLNNRVRPDGKAA